MSPLFVLLILFLSATQSSSASFQCKANAKCNALVDYVPLNATTLAAVQSLFAVRNLRSLLGANNLPLSTLSNLSVPANQPLKIPFPCLCRNGTGISNKRPNYTVVSGDTLYHVAAEIFRGLVTYQEIGKVNNIPDLNNIDPGLKLWIPLPCSCDDVAGLKVVHYGLIVAAGSSVEGIADQYGTSGEILMELNGIKNASDLLAGQVLDVPLQACNTSILSKSPDYPLLVANNTYSFTANNCVKCKCDSANNWKLQCEPSGFNASNNWSSCPSMQCEGSDNLYIGNTTTSGCNTCAYAGFSSNRTIFTTLVTESTCSEPGGFSSSIDSSWSFLLISFNLILLYIHLY